jgi:orotate phosphoribosyltransferase
MNANELREVLEEQGGLLTGHFRLSSGRHSDLFVQTAAILKYTGIAERLGHELALRFVRSNVSVVLGPAMGGVIIGHEIARYLGVPMIYAEREDGELKLRRGFTLAPGDTVLIAENTVTTGGSQKETIDLARTYDVDIAGVAAIVDRSPGVSFGVPFEVLLKIDATSWDASDCPLCAQGSELVSPGSRHLSR